LLDQLLNNLLDNASHHTPAGTSVRVQARPVGRAVEVIVSDDGPGLPPETRARLASDVRDASAGLGLPIVAAIVRLHDGNLTVSPRSAGTAITVSLPRAD
jgi:signal transduction histidine kinase